MRSLTRGMAAPLALAALLRLPAGPLGPVLEAAQPRWLWPALRHGAGARHDGSATDPAAAPRELHGAGDVHEVGDLRDAHGIHDARGIRDAHGVRLMLHVDDVHRSTEVAGLDRFDGAEGASRAPATDAPDEDDEDDDPAPSSLPLLDEDRAWGSP